MSRRGGRDQSDGCAADSLRAMLLTQPMQPDDRCHIHSDMDPVARVQKQMQESKVYLSGFLRWLCAHGRTYQGCAIHQGFDEEGWSIY